MNEKLKMCVYFIFTWYFKWHFFVVFLIHLCTFLELNVYVCYGDQGSPGDDLLKGKRLCIRWENLIDIDKVLGNGHQYEKQWMGYKKWTNSM